MTSTRQDTQIGSISLFNLESWAVTSSPYWTTAKRVGHLATVLEFAARYKTNGKEAGRTSSVRVTQSYLARKTLTRTSALCLLSFSSRLLRRFTFLTIYHTHTLICCQLWIKWPDKITAIIIESWLGRQFVEIELRCWRLGIFRNISRLQVRWMCQWLCCWRDRMLARQFLVGCFTFFLCSFSLTALKPESSETSSSSKSFPWSIRMELSTEIIDVH